MGDLGAADQLTSAREENKILKAKVEEFKEKIKDLTITNAQLLAEVEIYRKESPIPSSSFSNIALGQTPNNNPSSSTAQDRDSHFVSSGNGKFPTSPEVSLLHLHSFSNPLCCALDPSDTILATGGADSSVSIVPWGSALAPGEESSRQTVDKAARVVCSAPVICVRFSGNNIVAAGCMDGSVHLIGYRLELGRVRAWSLNIANQTQIKHTKYVKSMDWAPGVDAGGASILASASADGTVQICKIAVELEDVDVDMDDDGSDMNIHANANNATARVDLIKSLHMTGAVEAVCFVNDGDKLCIYERGTSHLAYFDLNDDFKMSTFSLNGCECVLLCFAFIMFNLQLRVLYMLWILIHRSSTRTFVYTLAHILLKRTDQHICQQNNSCNGWIRQPRLIHNHAPIPLPQRQVPLCRHRHLTKYHPRSRNR